MLRSFMLPAPASPQERSRLHAPLQQQVHGQWVQTARRRLTPGWCRRRRYSARSPPRSSRWLLPEASHPTGLCNRSFSSSSSMVALILTHPSSAAARCGASWPRPRPLRTRSSAHRRSPLHLATRSPLPPRRKRTLGAWDIAHLTCIVLYGLACCIISTEGRVAEHSVVYTVCCNLSVTTEVLLSCFSKDTHALWLL